MSNQFIPLSQLADILGGFAFKSQDLGDAGYSVVKIANIEPPNVNSHGSARVLPKVVVGLDRFKLKAGDILMAMTGATTGKVGRIRSSETLYLNQRVAKLSAKVGPEYGDFIYAIVSQPGFDQLVMNNAHGSAQPNVSADGIGRILIPHFHPDEQLAIGRCIGALDDKIESNRRTSRTLEKVVRAIFRAWFVDFEPVKAKGSGARSFLGMPQEVFDALPTRLVDSRLGPIPEDWEVGRLGENCEINALSVKQGDINANIEYIDISSVTVGRLDSVRIVPYSDAPSRARRRVRHGDTIWSCVRPNHRSYLFIHTPPDHRIVSTGFAVLSPRSFGPSLLHQLTIQPEFVEYLVANADGSAYPAVRPDHFEVADVIVPPSSIREAFEAITMPCRDHVAFSDRECEKLSALRDYLLPKLLNGEVRVTEAGEIVGEGLTR